VSEPSKRPIRAAVYCRKSSEEGLHLEFSSIDAQHEGGLAYIASQRSEGWVPVAEKYIDGGWSGGSLERPALQRLLADIAAGRIDRIVVSKIDRLTRSLRDFGKLIDLFEKHNVGFVATTQNFATSNALGRLSLHILLSFAEFEREIAGERIRDKIRLSKQRGRWTGGPVPFGYRPVDRRLVIVEPEAEIVARVFRRFAQTGSVTLILRELQKAGVTRRGKSFDKAALYAMLKNEVYHGRVTHRGEAFQGLHEAIVGEDLWREVRERLEVSPRTRANANRTPSSAMLRGLIFDGQGRALSPTHTRKGQRKYRYYALNAAMKAGATGAASLRVNAGEVEQAVVNQLRALLTAPEIVAQTALAVRETLPTIDEATVRQALQQFEAMWSLLFPAEQARIVQLLVEKVVVHKDGLDVVLRTGGLGLLARELLPNTAEAA
jgi:DNA invertase Pin-like site-specific DNA recombinase